MKTLFTASLLMVSLACVAAGLTPEATKIRAQIYAMHALIKPTLAAADGIGARTLRDGEKIWPQTVKWKDELLELARTPVDWTTVEFADRDLRANMDMIFQSWSGNTPAQTALIGELKASPMPALQEYGKAKERLAILRQQPLNLSFIAVDGRKVDLAELRGKPVIVAYWSSGCQGSRKQIPKLTALYQRHHAAGLEIVGLNFDSDEERAATERFAAEQRLVWPHRVDRQLRREEFARYGFVWVSNVLLLDKQGRLLRSAPSPDLEEWDHLIREQLKHES